jgi:hypothetical protein
LNGRREALTRTCRGVMKQYGLGPNGAIMTALNLYATKFDQVISLIEVSVHFFFPLLSFSLSFSLSLSPFVVDYMRCYFC